jgi:two-component sensor histidine kinase
VTPLSPALPVELVLLEEFAHRVVNEYALAIATLRRAAERAPDCASGELLRDTAERLRAQANAHRALQPPIGEGPCDVAEHLARVCAALTEASLAAAGVRLRLVAEPAELPSERCWRLGLIVAELIHNSLRHGGHRECPEIVVELAQGPGGLRCLVRDNGAFNPSPAVGRGRRVVSALAAGLDGQALWSFTRLGSQVQVLIPAATAEPVTGRL